MKHTHVFTLAVGLALVGSTAMADDKTAAKTQAQRTKSESQQKQVKDPVCGMMVDPKTAAAKATYQGKTYYFCSRDEKEKFEKAPEQYVKGDKK